jgi:hypothetical protein
MIQQQKLLHYHCETKQLIRVKKNVDFCRLKLNSILVLAKMRAANTDLNIISYAQFHQLDPSKIKIRQPNYLFDIDPTKRNPNKITRADAQNVIPSSVN